MPNNNENKTDWITDPEAADKKAVDKKAADKKDDGKISVDAAVLEEVLSKLKNLETQNEELKTAQKEYEQTASQDQILKIEKLRASGKLVKAVRINFYDGQMVTEWRSTADDVYIEPATGKEVSVQKTKLIFSDGKEKEIPQLDFARRKLQREYEVIKEGKDKDGNMLYTVLTEGGKEIEIDGRYIN